MALSTFFNQIVPDYKYESYYTIDGYAYTEDHLIVYKLFVYKIPRKTTVGEIRKYFTQYGNIKNVRLFPDIFRNYHNVAFVHFESPTAAARVLNFFHTTCVGRLKPLYLVKVCDSWHQPNCQFTKKMLQDWSIRPKKSGEEDQFFLPNSDSILVLNDDCLENILRFLPLSSQLQFARSCSRICEVLQRTSKLLYRTLFLAHLDNLTHWQIRDFFDFAGAYIIRIKGKLPAQDGPCIVKSMSKYCTNLEELDLALYPRHRPRYDLFVQLFRKLKKLKILKLPITFNVSGRDLKTLSPTIERLSVNCIDFKDEHIISLLKSSTKLKELNLGGNMCLNYTLVNGIAMSCQNLEALTFDYNQSDYGLLAKLPKLKKLTVFLRMESSPCSPVLIQLGEHNSHTLEFLRIVGINCISDNDAQQISRLKALRSLDCSHSYKLTDNGLRYFCDLEHLEEINLRYCKKITNTALINLVLKCEKLKLINLEGCILLFNNLIFDLIRKMKEQIQNKTFMRTEPVLLMGWLTSIEKDILNDPEYKASSHLVTVHFGKHI